MLFRNSQLFVMLKLLENTGFYTLKMERNRIILFMSIYVLVACYGVESSTDDSLRIGAFNIQVFGKKKAANSTIMGILTKIIRRYDLLLIQEIRDSSETAIYKLLDQVNRNQSTDKRYMMIVSRRLGRTHSKEQYAYMYRPSAGLTITEAYEFEDGPEIKNPDGSYRDLFQREPFLVKVKSKYTVPSEFVVIGIHVAPEQAVKEINQLEVVFDHGTNTMHVPNVVAMGDLNADCSYVSKSALKKLSLRKSNRFKWFIGDKADTTVKSTECAYDRFIFTGQQWTEGMVPLSARVYKFDEDIRLLGEMSKDLAVRISDHYPIEFQLLVSPTFRISGVYVELKHRKSLRRNVKYQLRGAAVVDDNETVIGRLRKKYKHEHYLVTKIIQILTRGLNSGPVKVERTKQRYRESQQSRLIIPVSAEYANEVQNILFHSCRSSKYSCS